MSEQDQRGCIVLYKEKKYFVDMNTEKFKQTQSNYPNIKIRIFWEKSFYHENSIGPVLINELKLPSE